MTCALNWRPFYDRLVASIAAGDMECFAAVKAVQSMWIAVALWPGNLHGMDIVGHVQMRFWLINFKVHY